MSQDRPQASSLAEAKLAEWPLAAEQKVEGDPRPQGAVTWQSADGRQLAGFWKCSPGAFSRTYLWTEVAFVEGGRATIEHDGDPIRLEPGSLLVLPAGTTAVWRIEEEITKSFSVVADDPIQL